MNIYSLYIPSQDSINKIDLNSLMQQPPEPFIIQRYF